MRSLVYLISAMLVLVAGLLLLAPSMPQNWPAIPENDANGETIPRPSPPKPEPPPAPQQETHWAAKERSEQTGRPLVLLFTAEWCPACVETERRLLPDLRRKGELGIVNTDREPDLAGYYRITEIPAVMVYSPTGNKQWAYNNTYIGFDGIGNWARSALARMSEPVKPASQELPLPTEATRRAVNDKLRLLVVYDGSPQCAAMLPVFKSVEAAGYDVAYANANRPENRPHLERFKVDVSRLPHMTMYRGHEALETTAGPMTQERLTDWFKAAAAKKPSGLPHSESQDFLGTLDRPELQRFLSPGSCGMLGCMAHGGGLVLETVDSTGQVTAASSGAVQSGDAACPTGCPSCRRR